MALVLTGLATVWPKHVTPPSTINAPVTAVNNSIVVNSQHFDINRAKGGNGSINQGGDGGDSYISTNAIWGVVYGAQGGGAGPGGRGGKGGGAYVAGKGNAYGGQGGSTDTGGVGGEGGYAEVHGEGDAYGGDAGNSGLPADNSTALTPKDLGLPKQFWESGRPGHDGLVVISWGSESDAQSNRGTVIFTTSNRFEYPGTLFKPTHPLPGMKRFQDTYQESNNCIQRMLSPESTKLDEG
jgi:hypothetical protein